MLADEILPRLSNGRAVPLLDISDWGPWQPERICYDEEEVLDHIAGRYIFAKARTVEELDATLGSSRGKPGSVTVWNCFRARWSPVFTREAIRLRSN